MDAHRWCNVCAARWDYDAGETAMEGWPQDAIIEVSARCNLRCVMCPISYDPRYQPGSGRPALFTPQLFERLRPLFPTLLRADLFGLGEPVLNPHLTDFIGELHAAGVEVRFTTNATLIDDERAEAFARAGADRISVSIDGASAGIYEAIRRGGRFEGVLRGLEALCRARRRHGRPRVTVSFVAMAMNVHEIPRLVDLCREIGVEEVNVEPLFDWGGDSPELAEHYQREALSGLAPEELEGILGEARRRAGAAGLYFNSPFLASHGSADYRQRVAELSGQPGWRCSEPWRTILVTVAGEVRPCCLNGESLGSLREQTFEEIWNGPAYRAFRRQHVAGLEMPTGCAACLANGRQRHSEYFAAIEPVSFRPLLGQAPPPPPKGGVTLDWPRDKEVVTDPLVLTGRLGPPLRRRLPWLGRRSRVRLLIDRCPVGFLDDAVVEGDRFAACIPVPYLSEGAHLLSLRADDDTDPGWGRRTIHFWRLPEGWRRLAATGTAAAFLNLSRRSDRSEIRIDGQPWPAARWLCGRGRRGWVGGALVDLDGLAAGLHRLEVLPEGAPRASYRLERLAV